MKISEENPRHLFQRILRAKAKLTPVEPEYAVVYERPGAEGEVSVCTPSPEWMAMAMAGGYLPPVEVYHQLRCRWVNEAGEECFTTLGTHPGSGWKEGTVVNGHLLHTVKPIGPMTQEEAIEYILQKDVPRAVWADHDRANRPRFHIVPRSLVPRQRGFRNCWRLNTPA